MKTFPFSTLFCGGALALSLCFAPARAAEPTQGAPTLAAPTKLANVLAATRWQLTSPVYAGLQNKPTLRFDNASLGASVGLNLIGGGYQIDGTTIKVSPLRSTRKAGPPALMRAETQYSRALQNVRTFELSRDGQTLTLRGQQTLTFQRANAAQTNPLAGTKWQLTAPVYAGAKEKPTLNLSDDNLGASVGLNVMGASYKIVGSNLKLEQFIGTLMAGPPELMRAEDAYKKALTSVRSYQIAPDGQTLTLRGDQVLTFARVGQTKAGFVATATKIINVAPVLGPQPGGDKTPKYLQLEDLSVGENRGRFTAPEILGFDFQPGNRYQLRVQIERDAQTDAERLRLLEVFSQRYVATAKLGADDVILEVAPTKADCVGVAPMKCLLVRQNGGDWRNFYAPIEGFDWVEGSRYRLQVKVSKIANPPADASSIRYQLVRVLDKMPVTY